MTSHAQRGAARRRQLKGVLKRPRAATVLVAVAATVGALLGAQLTTAGPSSADDAVVHVETSGNNVPSCGSAVAPCRTINYASGRGETVVLGPGSFAGFGVTPYDTFTVVGSPAGSTITSKIWTVPQDDEFDGCIPHPGPGTATYGVTLNSVTIAGSADSTAVESDGGSITINDSTIDGAGTALDASGGCIFVNDSTIANNTRAATVGDGELFLRRASVIANGAGISGTPYGDTRIAGVATTVGTTSTGSIIAGNGTAPGGDYCTTVIEDAGYNLFDDASCAVTASTSSVHTDVGIGAFDRHGGATETYALDSSGPAIDQIPANDPLCGGTDQRGVPRPQGGACDIGAVEAAAATMAVTATPVSAQLDQPVTLTVMVAASRPGLPTPEGTVTFTGAPGCANVPVTSGVATCTTSSLPAGADLITADYASSNSFHAARAQITVEIAPTPYTDPGQIAENTSWPNAAPLTSAGVDGTLTADGQARWYKFPVQPDAQELVTLSNLDRDYDLTLYGDIGAEFTRLMDDAPSSTTDLNNLQAEHSGSEFSPSIYSPSIYSPSIYSPSIYSPSIYSPSIYSPSIYSPSIYSPSIYSPSIYSPSIYSPSKEFLQAFSDAQALSLLGISANDGIADESIDAATWNDTGDYYVRVQGRNGVSSAEPFHLDLTTTAGACSGVPLDSFTSEPTSTGSPGTAQNVILVDSSRMDITGALSTDLQRLATATHGVVVDVARSPRVAALNAQADASINCAYAKNLVAQSIRDIVNSYRDNSGTLKYVTIIGDDDVIPFFRYPDAAGIGPEQDYVPPVRDTTASQASLRTDDVLGQDAYGAARDLHLTGGLVLPLTDAAVGRLVETPDEIDGQIQNFLGLTDQTLPTPTSSLVTGYDFLTSAADSVAGDLSAGLGPDGRVDQLITDQGVPRTVTTGPDGPSRTTSWTATDLSDALLASHHDLVFLAGHFSANNTLAADYSTTLATPAVDAHQGLFTNSLVFSPGCHSGYNLVDADGVPGLTLGLDWAEEMARQQAILVAGTGYQYADTDFLAYSAKLYTMFAHDLRAGRAGTPVAIGAALVQAKQDYLAGLTSVTGIDQKSLLEAAVYGLPMTGLDLPDGRTGAPTAAAPIDTAAAAPGTPGATLGLRSAQLDLDTTATPNSRAALNPDGSTSGTQLSWLTGPDGVITQPALPALPAQSVNATSSRDESLRGVGFRSGSYTDTPGVTPLTGAPATEQNGVHTNFASPAFYPQKLAVPNYFGALGTGTSSDRTRLILTPAQYRSDSPGALTDTQRSYSKLGLTLYYSHNTGSYGQNTPALAAAPSISGVTSSVAADGVTVAAHVTGDPAAGIQQVWVTYTAAHGPFHGTWASVDLSQDAADSTLWTGRITLPAGQDPSDVRFLLQAVNGVGLVGADNNLGDYFTPGVTVGAVSPNASATQLTLDPVPATVAYGSTLTLGATLTGAPVGSTVTFDLGDGPVPAVTDTNGHATVRVPVSGAAGQHTVVAGYGGDDAHLSSTARTTYLQTKAATTLTMRASGFIKIGMANGQEPARPLRNIGTGLYAVLTSGGQPLPQRSVVFTFDSVLFGRDASFVRSTGPDGRARLGTVPLVPGLYRIRASFGTGQPGTAVDPSYEGSETRSWTGLLLPGISLVVR
jgi:hypothetical protein